MKRIPEFTEKQMVILDMIAEDLSIREISRMLNQGEENIKQMRHRIRLSIGLETGQNLKEWLYSNGWEKPDHVIQGGRKIGIEDSKS